MNLDMSDSTLRSCSNSICRALDVSPIDEQMLDFPKTVALRTPRISS